MKCSALAAVEAGAVFAYGNFITIPLINFIILAFIVFQMVKQINRIKKRTTLPWSRRRHRRRKT